MLRKNFRNQMGRALVLCVLSLTLVVGHFASETAMAEESTVAPAVAPAPVRERTKRRKKKFKKTPHTKPSSEAKPDGAPTSTDKVETN